MTPSTYATRLIRMLVLGVIVAGTVASVAEALPVVDTDGTSPQANFSTPQGLKADGLRLQGIARVYQQTASAPTPQGLKADGLRLQGIAQVYQQTASAPTSQGLKADGLRLQGIAQVYKQGQPVSDVLERFANTHPYGFGLSSATSSTLVRHAAQPNVAVPDVLERYATTHPYGIGVSSAAQSTASQSRAFDWADYGIGIGSGMGLVLVLAGALAMGWQRRHRVQTA